MRLRRKSLVDIPPTRRQMAAAKRAVQLKGPPQEATVLLAITSLTCIP